MLFNPEVSQVVLVVKNPPVNAGDIRDAGSVPGSGRSPGGGHGDPLQYSCWRIPWTEEPGGLQSIGLQNQTRLTRLSTHAQGFSLSGVLESPGGLVDKEPACSAGDLGSIPGLGRCPGEGNSYPLHYSGLESSKGVAKSQT